MIKINLLKINNKIKINKLKIYKTVKFNNNNLLKNIMVNFFKRHYANKYRNDLK
jgi:hypothetical protein